MKSLLSLLFLVLIGSVVVEGLKSTSEEEADDRLIRHVDTRIGGGGSGALTGCINPGPQVPYGAMRLGPDTSLGLEPYHSTYSCGYQYKDPQIMCFSHTHLVGAGLTDFQNIGITMVRGEIKMDGLIKDSKYGSPFSHDTEIARPGYYAVTLEKWNTRAELTVGGTHAGIHRYTCWKNGGGGKSNDNNDCTLLVDICHSSVAALQDNINGACKSARINELAYTNSGGATLSAFVDNFGGFSWMSLKGIHIHFKAEISAYGATTGKKYTFAQAVESNDGGPSSPPACWMNNELSSSPPNNTTSKGCPFVGVNTSSHSLGALFTIQNPPEDIQFEVRAAISFLSEDNADALLRTQLQGTNSSSSSSSTSCSSDDGTTGSDGREWLSFDQVKERAETIWEETLGNVQVHVGGRSEEGKEAAKRPLVSYYSALYRTHLAPTTYTEFGEYKSENDHIRRVGTYNDTNSSPLEFMSDLSIWDIYRSQMPLTLFTEPLVARNTAWSMMEMYKERGFLPVWVLFNMETFCMVGEHSAVILGDFIRKGLKGIDINGTFDAIVRGIRTQNMQKIPPPLYYQPYEDILQYGIGSDTLDFAIDAAAVRNTALHPSIKNYSIAEEFEPFAAAWQNLWNHQRNIFCPRMANGTWVCPKNTYRPVYQLTYREDNAGEYRWYVPQNLTGLVDIWNNTAAYAQNLNDLFAYGQLWPLQSLAVPDEFFWAGNEPDMMAPLQFPAAGNEYAWLTDKWIAATLREYYTSDPDYRGLPGNDDFGTLSAFEVFAMSGFYPISSTNDYVLSTPWFVNSTWYVSPNGASFSPFPGASSFSRKILEIRCKNHPGTAALWTAAGHLNGFPGGNSFYYVQFARINGVNLTKRTFTHDQLLDNLQEGERTLIEVDLVNEPVVFGEAAPTSGGPSPFFPQNLNIQKKTKDYSEKKVQNRPSIPRPNSGSRTRGVLKRMLERSSFTRTRSGRK